FALGLLAGLAASVPGVAQDLRPTCPTTAFTAKSVSATNGDGPGGCRWSLFCFPRCDCPDDYCAHPYPRQCWPPYPPFYRCGPAGDCGHPPCTGVGNEGLSWWWIPTPRALREALWRQP